MDGSLPCHSLPDTPIPGKAGAAPILPPFWITFSPGVEASLSLGIPRSRAGLPRSRRSSCLRSRVFHTINSAGKIFRRPDFRAAAARAAHAAGPPSGAARPAPPGTAPVRDPSARHRAVVVPDERRELREAGGKQGMKEEAALPSGSGTSPAARQARLPRPRREGGGDCRSSAGQRGWRRTKCF